MYSDILELCTFTNKLVEDYLNKIDHWAKVYILYWRLNHLIERANHALIHYFPIPLDSEGLKNSSLGSPEEKWAKYVNDDFDLLTDSVVQFSSALEDVYIGLNVYEQESIAMRHQMDSFALEWFEVFSIRYYSGHVEVSNNLTLSKASIAMDDRTLDGSKFIVGKFPYHPFKKEASPLIINRILDINTQAEREKVLTNATEMLVQIKQIKRNIAGIISNNCSIDSLLISEEGLPRVFHKGVRTL